MDYRIERKPGFLVHFEQLLQPLAADSLEHRYYGPGRDVLRCKQT
jgi:hypothetical protein